MAEIDRFPDYNSGDDLIILHGAYLFAFNKEDFLERTERAARVLELVSAPLDEDELLDLAEFMVEDEISNPRSPLASHLDDNHETLVRGNRDDGNVIEWMRRVVFTEAMLDKHVLEGQLDVKFDETTGRFKYVYPGSEEEVKPVPRPSWGDLAYNPGA